MNINFLLSLSDNDKKLLIILLVIFVILFIILGLLGMLLRYILQTQSKRMDDEVHDAVIYKVIQGPDELLRYGDKKNMYLFLKQSIPPLLIFLFSMIFYIVYNLIAKRWSDSYFTNFSTIFFKWDFSDESCYVNFWGLRLLACWPPLINTPHFVDEYWASYVLVPLWLTSIIYYLIVVQGFIVRKILLNKRVHSIFGKTLEGYSFYDSLKNDDIKIKVNNNSQKQEENLEK